MANEIIKFMEEQFKQFLPFVSKFDMPVYRLKTGQIYKGKGFERTPAGISDFDKSGLYVRELSPEIVKPSKKFTSLNNESENIAKLRAVYYSFNGEKDPDKIKSKMLYALQNMKFIDFTGSAYNIVLTITNSSVDFEKIFFDETGNYIQSGLWPAIVSVDFTINYMNSNCEICDIEA